jgi:hypothetical protein
VEKLSEKKLPETDDERIDILRAALEQEETNKAWDKILSIAELQDLRVLITKYEGDNAVFNQAITDRAKAKSLYDELFKNAQLYVSHFIQVLFLTVIRNEIKPEYLPLYGFQENSPSLPLPRLLTEEAVLTWAEKLMKGETERTYRGGTSLYNPTIAKVKVHYELFKEAIYSLSIYEKNLARLQNNISEIRKSADEFIGSIWTKVEERYSGTSPEEQSLRFKAYKIQYLHRTGTQLNVFD